MAGFVQPFPVANPNFNLPGIFIRGIEVTQSVQYYQSAEHLTDPVDQQPDNSIPLVANKTALVRVYLRNDKWYSTPEVVYYPPGCEKPKTNVDVIPPCAVITPANIYTFAGTLDISRFRTGYVETPPDLNYVPVARLNARVDGAPITAYANVRGVGFNTLQFTIPAEEMHGLLRLHVTVTTPDGRIEESTEFVEVSLKQTLHIRAIMVGYEGPASSTPGAVNISRAAPTMADLQATSSLAVAMFPVQSNAEYSVAERITWTKPLDDELRSPRWKELIEMLKKIKDNDVEQYRNRSDIIYYGCLAAGIPIPNAATINGLDDPDIACGFVRPFINAEFIMAHELGHACGLLHTPCGNPPPDSASCDPSYPGYSPYAKGSIGEYGVDLRALAPVFMQPAASSDVMGYFPTKAWISPYSYCKLLRQTRLHPEYGERGPKIELPYDPNWIPKLNLPDPPPFNLPGTPLF